jgi:hypothetical protein
LWQADTTKRIEYRDTTLEVLIKERSLFDSLIIQKVVDTLTNKAYYRPKLIANKNIYIHPLTDSTFRVEAICPSETKTVYVPKGIATIFSTELRPPKLIIKEAVRVPIWAWVTIGILGFLLVLVIFFIVMRR